MVCRYRKYNRSEYTSYGQGHEHHTIKLLTMVVELILHIYLKIKIKGILLLIALNLFFLKLITFEHSDYLQTEDLQSHAMICFKN